MDDDSTLDPSISFELAALRLHLVVGMAAADDEIHDDEIVGMTDFVAACTVTDAQRRYLEQLLLALVADPPRLDDLLRRLVDRIADRTLARELVDDLVVIARSDGHVDPREEGMLRLVCGALELDPVSLYDTHERAAGDVHAADLARLVRNLLELDAVA
jgi:tellurite resistance protein